MIFKRTEQNLGVGSLFAGGSTVGPSAVSVSKDARRAALRVHCAGCMLARSTHARPSQLVQVGIPKCSGERRRECLIEGCLMDIGIHEYQSHVLEI